MDANRAETEIENKKLHDQLNAFQVLKNALVNYSYTFFCLVGNRIDSIESSTVS